jgi:hypothetical protein
MASSPALANPRAYGAHTIGFQNDVYQHIIPASIEIPNNGTTVVFIGNQQEDPVPAQFLPNDIPSMNVFCKLTCPTPPTPFVPVRYWFLFQIKDSDSNLIYQGMWDLAVRNYILFKWSNNRAGQASWVICSEYLNIDGTLAWDFSPTGSLVFEPQATELSVPINPTAPGLSLSWPPFNSGRPSF